MHFSSLLCYKIYDLNCFRLFTPTSPQCTEQPGSADSPFNHLLFRGLADLPGLSRYSNDVWYNSVFGIETIETQEAE